MAGLDAFLNSVSPVVNILAQLQGRKQANKAITAGNVPTAAEVQQNALYKALSDPNSPLLAQMTAQDRASNLSSFQQQLTEMQLADRRAGANGQAPAFFSPETADQTMSYLTSRGLPQLDAASRQSAQARILAAAGGYGGMVPAQAGRNAIGIQQGVSNAQSGSQIPQMLMSSLSGLFGTQKQGQPAQQTAPMMGYQMPMYGQQSPMYGQQPYGQAYPPPMSQQYSQFRG